MESFYSDFARRVGVDHNSVDEVLEMLSEYVWGQVLDDGRCHIPGLGSFYMVDGKKLFEPDSELARVVNHQFAGLNVLAVEESGSHVLIGADFDESVADDFEPRWEEKPVVDRDESDTPVLDDRITLTEDNFEDTPLPAAGAEAVSSSSNSFLDIDLDDTVKSEQEASAPSEVESASVNQAADESALTDDPGLQTPAQGGQDPLAFSGDDALEEESFSASDSPADSPGTPLSSGSDLTDRETAELAREIGAAENVAAIEGDAGVDPDAVQEDKLVIPVDENAEPVVAKGKPRASIWFYVLPILAMAFLLMAIYWAQTRQRTPRPVAQPPAVATEPGNPDATSGESASAVDGTTDGVDEATPEPAEPSWQPGGIDLAAGGWSIIVSSKPTRSEAETIAAQIAEGLSDTPHAVDVIESTVNGQTRYRVAVGQFRTSTQTQREINRLGAQLPDGSWALPLNSNQ